jgi:hypothetical protein
MMSVTEARLLQRPPKVAPMGAFSHDELAQFGARLMDVVQLSLNGVVEIRWQRELGQFHLGVRVSRHKRRCLCGDCPDPKRRHLIKEKSLPLAVERAFEWLSARVTTI